MNESQKWLKNHPKPVPNKEDEKILEAMLTEKISTPYGIIETDKIITALEAYYALPKEIQIQEKQAWLDLFNKIMKSDKKITDIQLGSTKGDVTFKFE